MLFRPFYGVMYGFVIRIACVVCIYMRAYIIISTYVRAKEKGVFCVRFASFSHLILTFVASNGLAFV